MTIAGRLGAALGFAAAFVASAPVVTLAADPTFGQPTASASLGEPVAFSSTIEGVEGGTVEVLVGLVGREPRLVVAAQPGTVANEWQASAAIDLPTAMECTCFADGQSAPNSNIEYRFRVRAADGTVTLGPPASVRVSDERFAWRTVEDRLVRVHWYEGDDAFAQDAATVANDAIERASELLGTTLPAPVDLFIYATQEALLEAVSPNRDSIAGQAHSNIGTMFVWIPPTQDPEDSGVIVAHELTHLVFNEATFNRFRSPPRWLNEGIATYLSEGYVDDYRAIVNVAASSGTLIPIDGLAGLFPSPDDQFYLAYGESVAAVDYFVRTYSDQTLWELVRSYAQGLSDDDAFEAATGGDVAAFNEAWMASLGAGVREPVGPQPAPAGPVPSGWHQGQSTVPPGSPRPGQTPAPGESPAAATPRPPAGTEGPTIAPTPTIGPGEPAADETGTIVLAVLAGLAILFAVLILLVLVQRGRKRRPPPPPYRY